MNTAEANRMQERRYRGREASRVSNRQLFIQRSRVAINWKNKAEGEECDCIAMSLSVRGNGVSGKGVFVSPNALRAQTEGQRSENRRIVLV